MWLLPVLVGCGAEEVPENPAAGSAMAESLRQAAAGIPDEPDPQAMPERLARESEKRVAATDENDSAACMEAKTARDKVKKRVTSFYEDRIRPAEDRAYRAQLALDACLKDLGGCGADPNEYKGVAQRRDSANKALERELESAGTQEAKLFPLNQEVARACGRTRG